ncbi:NAD(P)-dependent oxidoreductase [Thiocystis violacea]|uniref:NAD(P)-dependent oxidoreductase n=1 Tax=Thiocystis violacea TaxID=13725 RepID=UPI0019040424|nr:NAD(P)-binding oxidoreductase [Thiocystis violacea]MBK1716636.1 3-beta hydroxysteroid dehydrogenase [Thiocystis violacea]
MKVVVFGASGKAGRTVALTLLAAGHQVTAFGRDPAKLPAHKGISIRAGDAMNAADVASAVAGQDAVVVSLGDSRNPVLLKLPGAKRPPPSNICEMGTANVIAAMAAASVKRLICITAYGVGDTRDRLSPTFRLWFRALQLREQLADKERQETLVKASGLDWTLIQPVGLTDGAATGRWLASTSGDRRKRTISRVDLADFITQVLEGGGYLRETVVLSQLAISERDFATQAA